MKTCLNLLKNSLINLLFLASLMGVHASSAGDAAKSTIDIGDKLCNLSVFVDREGSNRCGSLVKQHCLGHPLNLVTCVPDPECLFDMRIEHALAPTVHAAHVGIHLCGDSPDRGQAVMLRAVAQAAKANQAIKMLHRWLFVSPNLVTLHAAGCSAQLAAVAGGPVTVPAEGVPFDGITASHVGAPRRRGNEVDEDGRLGRRCRRGRFGCRRR